MRTLVLAAKESHFLEFRKTQPAAAQYLEYCVDEKDLETKKELPLVLVGPFWKHPRWDKIELFLRKQAHKHPHVSAPWFPLL